MLPNILLTLFGKVRAAITSAPILTITDNARQLYSVSETPGQLYTITQSPRNLYSVEQG